MKSGWPCRHIYYLCSASTTDLARIFIIYVLHPRLTLQAYLLFIEFESTKKISTYSCFLPISVKYWNMCDMRLSKKKRLKVNNSNFVGLKWGTFKSSLFLYIFIAFSLTPICVSIQIKWFFCYDFFLYMFCCLVLVRGGIDGSRF